MKSICRPATSVLVVLMVIMGMACNNAPSSSTPSEKHQESKPVASTDAPKENVTKPASNDFNKTLSLQGVSVQVAASGNTLVFRPSGLEDNSPWEHQIDGIVRDAQIEDMNSDGVPEILAFMYSGPNQKGNMIGYSCNGKKSMNQIYFPGIENASAEAANGYNGYDDLAIVERSLVQRFPVFQNGQRTGKTRQIQYKLANGENGRLFRVDRIVEY